MIIAVLIHNFCFYTVACPPLRLGNSLTYNTSLLRDELYLRHGYSVGTMASFLCDEFYPREGSSSVICQSSGNWGQQTPICNRSNENKTYLNRNITCSLSVSVTFNK